MTDFPNTHTVPKNDASPMTQLQAAKHKIEQDNKTPALYRLSPGFYEALREELDPMMRAPNKGDTHKVYGVPVRVDHDLDNHGFKLMVWNKGGPVTQADKHHRRVVEWMKENLPKP